MDWARSTQRPPPRSDPPAPELLDDVMDPAGAAAIATSRKVL
jgi:hypothetical protein